MDFIISYRIAQNVGGGKHWRIWRLSIDLPKFSHPNIVNTLKCNGKLIQFAKVLPSNYTSRVISSKFHPTNILRYTVVALYFALFLLSVVSNGIQKFTIFSKCNCYLYCNAIFYFIIKTLVQNCQTLIPAHVSSVVYYFTGLVHIYNCSAKSLKEKFLSYNHKGQSSIYHQNDTVKVSFYKFLLYFTWEDQRVQQLYNYHGSWLNKLKITKILDTLV